MERKIIRRSDLREMAIGETRTFYVPDGKACESGKMQAYNVQKVDNVKFCVSVDFKNYSLTITKLAAVE